MVLSPPCPSVVSAHSASCLLGVQNNIEYPVGQYRRSVTPHRAVKGFLRVLAEGSLKDTVIHEFVGKEKRVTAIVGERLFLFRV